MCRMLAGKADIRADVKKPAEIQKKSLIYFSNLNFKENIVDPWLDISEI